MARLVNALFLTTEAANSAVECLLKHGYQREDIAIALSDSMHNRQQGPQATANHADTTATGATLGGVIGALLTGAVAVGALVTIGPFAAAIAGLSAGGLGGSLLGALVGAGMTHEEAAQAAGEVEKGGIIVAVQADDDRFRAVQDLLAASGGRFAQAS